MSLMRFVVWIWKGSRDYQPEHVNHLYRQLDRVCPGRFSLVAITDDTRGFLPGVEVIRTPPAALALANLQSPEKQNFPSCYRRLWMFSEEAKLLGEQVMLIDVDLVFTADPSPLFLPLAQKAANPMIKLRIENDRDRKNDRDRAGRAEHQKASATNSDGAQMLATASDAANGSDLRGGAEKDSKNNGSTLDQQSIDRQLPDFVGWRPLRTWGKENRFGGGIYLLRTGTKTHVWTDFYGQQSIDKARQAGLRGSDQAWISHCLAGTETSWPKNCGIYSIRDLTHSAKTVTVRRISRQTIKRHTKPFDLPSDAIIVQFNGPQNEKPWCQNARLKHVWLEQHCA